MKRVYLLTGNHGKAAAASLIFNDFGIEAVPLDLDIPEIQANTSQEIANQAALAAYGQTGKPVIREDHSFYIDELGMPGPFMTYIDKQINIGQLLKILDTLNSRNGHFELAAAYVDTAGRLHEFSYQVPIELALTAAGDDRQRWERLIKFKDDDRVFAEYPQAERAMVWTGNFERIAQLIATES